MQIATEEARAAILNARAAYLNARIAQMTAENAGRLAQRELIQYGDQDFEAVIQESKCHHNDIVELMIHGNL